MKQEGEIAIGVAEYSDGFAGLVKVTLPDGTSKEVESNHTHKDKSEALQCAIGAVPEVLKGLGLINGIEITDVLVKDEKMEMSERVLH